VCLYLCVCLSVSVSVSLHGLDVQVLFLFPVRWSTLL
jgi:hypothetical protein